MDDADGDAPALSASTLAALNEFLEEREEADGVVIDPFREDWGLSQVNPNELIRVQFCGTAALRLKVALLVDLLCSGAQASFSNQGLWQPRDCWFMLWAVLPEGCCFRCACCDNRFLLARVSANPFARVPRRHA